MVGRGGPQHSPRGMFFLFIYYAKCVFLIIPYCVEMFNLGKIKFGGGTSSGSVSPSTIGASAYTIATVSTVEKRPGVDEGSSLRKCSRAVQGGTRGALIEACLEGDVLSLTEATTLLEVELKAKGPKRWSATRRPDDLSRALRRWGRSAMSSGTGWRSTAVGKASGDRDRARPVRRMS
ncbi:hypothetical protein B296_00049924 [Ensete ventricosum]|uniref:Uncharacterized protein n=1 Tax=Ensete ventricosum TaxID=4639 RepID=A0A426Y8Y2_ENSVE|nr:hypothetical protein B296_00049924 [Ensete ventricosum]